MRTVGFVEYLSLYWMHLRVNLTCTILYAHKKNNGTLFVVKQFQWHRCRT